MTTIKTKYKLAWWLLAIHTLLVLAWFGSTFLPSDNPDSSIGFMLMVVTGYILDFPIGFMFEKIIRPLRPLWTDNFPIWFAVQFSWFAVLGGSYWFCIGVIISNLRRRKNKDINIS